MTSEPGSRAETSTAFEERFSKMASSAYTMLSVALGSRLGLFHKMAAREEPWTPEELAEAGTWKQRYVREWLGSMACAGIVEIVPSAEGDGYTLPQHRRDVLTGTSALFHEVFPMLGAVHEDIVDCFSKDGARGVSYSKFPYFHTWRNLLTEKAMGWDYIRNFNGATPGLTEKLSQGGRFLEIGCSTGVMLSVYAAKFPKSQFVGGDISEGAIHQAQENIKGMGLSNVEFSVCDVYKMPQEWTETFDGVVGFDVLHDFPHPMNAAKELRRVLKVGGILAIQDIFAHSRIADNVGSPETEVIYNISLFHCMAVSLHSGGIGAGAMWGRENVIECLKQAGFDEVIEPEKDSAHYVCVKK